MLVVPPLMSTTERPATLFVRLALFLVALAPAIVLLAVREAFVDLGRAALLLACSVPGAVVAVAFNHYLPAAEPANHVVVDAEVSDDGYAAFALGFLLPVALVDITSAGAMAGLMAFVAMFGLVWANSSVSYQNPVMALFGWHCWRVTLKRAGSRRGVAVQRVLLTRAGLVEPNDTIPVGQMDGPVWYGIVKSSR